MSIEDTFGTPHAVEFDIPFPTRMSPHLSWVRPRTVAWVRERDLVRSDEAEHRFVSWNLAYAAARIYPNAVTRDDLLKITNFFALGFLFDDQADHRDPGSVDRYVQVTNEMIAIPLRPPGAPLELVCPATRALRELWEQMTDEMSQRWCDRFALDFCHFHAANAHEARLSAAGRVPNLAEYITLRRATVGMFYSLDQTEWVGRYELPPAVVTHPLFAELREAASDTVSWMNDIHSHARETARQDPHNLLTVLIRRHGMTAAEALAEATRMTNTALRRFVGLCAGVPAMGDERAVDESVQGMANWIAGNHDWGRTTGRYGVTADSTATTDDMLVEAVRLE